MAFTVEDFRDLARLLEERPEWRAELRRLMLTEELLDLPAIVRELAEAQRRTEQQVRELAEAQRRTHARVDAFEARVDARFDRIEGHLANLRGSDLERRYRDHAAGYFGRLLRRARAVSPDELDTLLDEGLAAGALDEAAADDVRLADLIVRGRRPGEGGETYLVVEVSVGLDPADVERAARRAGVLGRVGPVLGVVAGERLTEEAAALAQARGVWWLLDGRALAPGER